MRNLDGIYVISMQQSQDWDAAVNFKVHVYKIPLYQGTAIHLWARGNGKPILQVPQVFEDEMKQQICSAYYEARYTVALKTA